MSPLGDTLITNKGYDMDNLFIGFNDDGELVETDADGYTEGFDTVVLSPGRKSSSSWATNAARTLGINP